MTRRIEDFNGLHALPEHPAHYMAFTNGGSPAEEVLDTVHGILKDVHDERYRSGIVDAMIVRAEAKARDIGGPAVLAIVSHSLTRSEIHKLRKQRISAAETQAA